MQSIRVFCCSCYLLIAVIVANAKYAAATTVPNTNGYSHTIAKNADAVYKNAEFSDTTEINNAAILAGLDVSTATQHDVVIDDTSSREQMQINEADSFADALTNEAGVTLVDNVKKRDKNMNIDSSEILSAIEENSITEAVRTAKQEGEEKTLTPNNQIELDLSVVNDKKQRKIVRPELKIVKNVEKPDVKEFIFNDHIVTKEKILDEKDDTLTPYDEIINSR